MEFVPQPGNDLSPPSSYLNLLALSAIMAAKGCSKCKVDEPGYLLRKCDKDGLSGKNKYATDVLNATITIPRSVRKENYRYRASIAATKAATIPNTVLFVTSRTRTMSSSGRKSNMIKLCNH